MCTHKHSCDLLNKLHPGQVAIENCWFHQILTRWSIEFTAAYAYCLYCLRICFRTPRAGPTSCLFCCAFISSILLFLEDSLWYIFETGNFFVLTRWSQHITTPEHTLKRSISWAWFSYSRYHYPVLNYLYQWKEM